MEMSASCARLRSSISRARVRIGGHGAVDGKAGRRRASRRGTGSRPLLSARAARARARVRPRRRPRPSSAGRGRTRREGRRTETVAPWKFRSGSLRPMPFQRSLNTPNTSPRQRSAWSAPSRKGRRSRCSPAGGVWPVALEHDRQRVVPRRRPDGLAHGIGALGSGGLERDGGAVRPGRGVVGQDGGFGLAQEVLRRERDAPAGCAWCRRKSGAGRDATVQPRRARLNIPMPAASSDATRSSLQPFSPKLSSTPGSAMPVPSSVTVTAKGPSSGPATTTRTRAAPARRAF